MNLVLLRHATRAIVLDFGSGESVLNSVGLAQAEDLVLAVKAQKKLPLPTLLVASPKLRARQTLTPLSTALSLEIKILNDLDERRRSESLSSFDSRVRAIFDVIKSHGVNETLYLCSHLDVLEAACVLWPTDFTDRQMAQPWSTLEYQFFKLKDGILHSGLRGRIEPRG